MTQSDTALLLFVKSGSSKCAPPVVTKCSIASLTCAGGLYFSKVSAALRAASLSFAANRSAFAPVTSTHWLVSSWDAGADSVELVSLDVATADVDLLPDWVADGADVVDLPPEHPAIRAAVTMIAANHHRWVTQTSLD